LTELIIISPLKIFTMSTHEIANRLVELCRTGQYETAQKELYASDAVSIETQLMPGFEKETRGLDAIIQKGQVFGSMVETIHGGSVSEPMIAGNTIAFTMGVDATWKDGKRTNAEELCVYNVKDGKIASEQFFS
jgi:hypothetical protein